MSLKRVAVLLFVLSAAFIVAGPVVANLAFEDPDAPFPEPESIEGIPALVFVLAFWAFGLVLLIAGVMVRAAGVSRERQRRLEEARERQIEDAS